MESSSPPESPAGYDEPYRVGYPTILLFIGSLALGLLAAGGFGWLLWTIQGEAIFEAAFEIEIDGEEMIIQHDLVGFGVPFLIALVVTVIVHELLHGLAFRLRGYTVEYGVLWRKGAFFTAAIGQFQRREDLFPVALTPLALITLVTLPLLFVPIAPVALTAYLVLILNTSGAIGDLYMCWRLWRMPPETLLYDVDIEHMYAFEPA